MIKIYDEKEPTLKEVQQIVKGWVEGLTLANGDGFFLTKRVRCLIYQKTLQHRLYCKNHFPKKQSIF